MKPITKAAPSDEEHVNDRNESFCPLKQMVCQIQRSSKTLSIHALFIFSDDASLPQATPTSLAMPHNQRARQGRFQTHVGPNCPCRVCNPSLFALRKIA